MCTILCIKQFRRYEVFCLHRVSVSANILINVAILDDELSNLELYVQVILFAYLH